MREPSRLRKAEEIIELAMMFQNSFRGLCISDIQEHFECSRRSAERMKTLLFDMFPEKIEEVESNDKKKRWRFVKGTMNSLITFVKDVIQFNENQQITEMVTEAGFEIAGTIALQFVPGLGQMAAARLAVSAARWGTKAVKVVRYAQKAEKVFSTVNKFQKGEAIANATTRTAKPTMQHINLQAKVQEFLKIYLQQVIM